MSRPTMPTPAMNEHFNHTLRPLAGDRNAVAFRRAIDNDPHRRVWWDFITKADGLPCDQYESVYSAILATIDRKVAAGTISADRPLSDCFAIVTVTTCKLRRQEFHRLCPATVGRLADPNGAVGPPLESQQAENSWRLAYEAMREELAARICPEDLEVFWAVQDYLTSHGTRHGALTAIARGGRVAKVGEREVVHPASVVASPPAAKRVYQLVVRRYHRSANQVRTILWAHGIPVPPI